MPYLSDPSAVTDLVVPDLANAVIAIDFDGTLAPIVDDPGLAAPAEGAIDALVDLADHVAVLAVVSGRPVSYLSRHLPQRIQTVGLYGLESMKDGVTEVHSNAGVWRETMADVATAAQLQGPKGMFVESKGLSITLHYRGRPELAEKVEEYAARAARSAGLRLRSARMSFELHPPIDEDKGTVLRRLAADLSGPVMYIGDDVGDLPAYDALDALAAEGRPTARICVSSPEVSSELIDRADLVINGPAAVVAFLGRLVRADDRPDPA